jgi:hypothetical protein
VRDAGVAASAELVAEREAARLVVERGPRHQGVPRSADVGEADLQVARGVAQREVVERARTSTHVPDLRPVSQALRQRCSHPHAC